MKDHKTELREQKLKRSYCIEPGCKFNGDFAAQGICFDRHPKNHDKYLSSVMKQGEDFLKEARRLRLKNGQRSLKGWLKYLEGHAVCSWMNDAFMLDELISLRAENAQLRKQIGKKRA